MGDLADYKARSGRLVPVWTLEVQTLPEDTDRILDAVLADGTYDVQVIRRDQFWALPSQRERYRSG